MDMREDTELTLTVDRLAFGGKGVARVDGLVVFVDGGLPGATVRAKVTRVKKGFAEARAVETLTPAPQAVAAPCPHFGVCGGCLHQDLDYAAQLFWKRQQVAETLSRLGGLRDVDVAPAVASPETYGYRNKMEFAFAGRLHLGLHERQRPGRVLDIEKCLLMDDRTGDILAFAREACAATGLAAYDPRTGKGVWRHLVVRRSLATGGRLVHLITGPSRRAGDAAHHFGEALLERFPDVSGFVHSVRRAPTTVAIGERQVFALGTDHLEERIGDVRLRISADAFAQTNTTAAEKLYAVVAQAAGTAPDRALWDVYCGCGGIALALAPGFETVYGVEADKRAVADAQKSAKLSERENCVFKTGDAATVLADLAATKPAVVTLDPPRAGADGQTLAAVMDAAPEKLVYVSCNPATLARDLKILSDLYTLTQVTPVDLFPHTAHIEVVAALELRR
ncbi:RNA methyltransferase, TrmA family [Solidesulfovibrio fructosivorans JJ]]|uniref:RNA methyltransferase, TrmA family n=1 Tax=Solidesulfovibrio fructosivorans JJ] TaxID=596151 RepID=E1JVL6_SOLFR|nr:23S rRNA (uracil(1939)-C(5))-methyltransferase RlmD [Solidesulfovibrio fructosivorans]EFL51504.1 RNA methyltransferase, TrmA family [Solidesulfovibrio fructosivorans JJ]]